MKVCTSILYPEINTYLLVEKSNVFLWLSGMGLQGYTSAFESNGFDDVKFMVSIFVNCVYFMMLDFLGWWNCGH